VESKEAKIRCMKYWEITAANLGKAGFSWGCVATVDCEEWSTLAPAQIERNQ